MEEPNPRPRFSLVSAAYNVSSYLEQFIDSIEGQTGGIDDVEVIMVDDGSTDDTLALLQAWAARNPRVRVITQPNAGQGPARNAGMAKAQGTWLSFPDPDDVFAPGYLAAVRTFLDQHPEVHAVATRRMMWNEATGRITDRHPLRFMFDADVAVDLADNPERFHGASNTTFFRLDELRASGLQFDPRVRPNFEDGHFNSHYLLQWERPVLGFASEARYRYRQRADKSSTLQGAKADVRRYTDVLEFGHLEVVTAAQRKYGVVPGWLTSFVLYELGWYVASTDSQSPTPLLDDDALSDRFHELVTAILASFDVQAALRNVTPALGTAQRMVLEHGFAGRPWHEPTAVLTELDSGQVRVSYYFTGDRPEETWLVDGVPMTPVHAKDRALDYGGRTLLRERIAWLPADRTLRLRRNGVEAALAYERAPATLGYAPAGQVRWWLDPSSNRPLVDTNRRVSKQPALGRRGKLARKYAKLAHIQRKYADAWVFIDRVHDALDSAEILFRHVRAHHPDINAWFVLEKGGAEWKRFVREGQGDRLVEYGSMEWRALMAHAAHLLSSHADQPVVAPKPILAFTEPGWRFHFLQHGVIKDDLSSWLNAKKIDTFVVSTRREAASIEGDDTPYNVTSREVALTGLPRFDRLRTKAEEFPLERRDLLLVAPTWRNGLTPPPKEGSQRREVPQELLDSTFLKQWLGYLTDPRLEEACRRQGVTIGFLPHPNLQAMLPLLDLPAHITPLSYEGNDVQALFARARAMVTDFSSTAFNAAYLDRPLVYFQFDEETVLGGGHVGRRGYFDYRRDGFGPVEVTIDGAVEATVAALDGGPVPAEPYLSRIRENFPERDGQCCERVVARVRAMPRTTGNSRS